MLSFLLSQHARMPCTPAPSIFIKILTIIVPFISLPFSDYAHLSCSTAVHRRAQTRSGVPISTLAFCCHCDSAGDRCLDLEIVIGKRHEDWASVQFQLCHARALDAKCHPGEESWVIADRTRIQDLANANHVDLLGWNFWHDNLVPRDAVGTVAAGGLDQPLLQYSKVGWGDNVPLLAFSRERVHAKVLRQGQGKTLVARDQFYDGFHPVYSVLLPGF